MADVYSTGYTDLSVTIPPVKQKVNMDSGRVRIYKDTYLQGASAGSIGDVIHCKKLPGGAKILPGAKLFWGTGTASETLAVGVTGSASKFLAATAAATAGNADMIAHLAAGVDYEVAAGGEEVIITDATAAIAAGQRITVWIPYTLD